MSHDPTKPYELKDLEKFYTDDEGCDKSIFAEMRSNIQLYAGEHYNKRDSNFFRRIRNLNDLPDEQKIRLTKNHIQKICKIYANHVAATAPGVGFRPKNQSELNDQKAAELHHAVDLHLSQMYRLKSAVDGEINDYVQIGEVICKVFYDTQAGDQVGVEPLIGEDGQQVIDPMTGQPQGDESKPVFRGKFVFERVYGMNLLRPSETVDIQEAERLTIRKMVNTDLLKSKFPDQEEQIHSGQKETYIVFDPSQSGYRASENETLLRETYFRPCPRYPKGYYFIHTKEVILQEGELPGGLFPIVIQTFDNYQTTARGRSPIKTMRPYQVEINRAASKIAEHQITLGDDKILLVNGSKASAGASLPGVRTVSITGQEPVIMSGRDGSQYLAYMSQSIEELYDVMMVKEIDLPDSGQVDPFSMLFMAASKKRHFQRYISRFEQYLIDKHKLMLSLAKIYLPDDEVILAVGKTEQVNISEFKNSNDINYEIYIEPQSEDVESKLGAQMAINQVIQYVGNKLEKEDVGRLMRMMPYGNFEKSFEDWTLDSDSANNLILALDRGEQPVINQFDDPIYLIKRLVSRMRQADFKLLPPQIQQTYGATLQQYEALQVDQADKLQRAQQGFIPTSGYLVVCDLYVGDPADPNKSRRARVPYDSLAWLIHQLEAQGKSLSDLENMNQAALGQMSDMLQAKNARGAANGMALPAPQATAMAAKESKNGRAAIPTTSRAVPAPSGGPSGGSGGPAGPFNNLLIGSGSR